MMGFLQRINTSSGTQAHSLYPFCYPQCVGFLSLGLLTHGGKLNPCTTLTHNTISHRKKNVQKTLPLLPPETFLYVSLSRRNSHA